jgi:hypothetical protein
MIIPLDPRLPPSALLTTIAPLEPSSLAPLLTVIEPPTPETELPAKNEAAPPVPAPAEPPPLIFSVARRVASADVH